MKYMIAFLLACVLGCQIANAVNAAVQNVTKAEKAGCKARVML